MRSAPPNKFESRGSNFKDQKLEEPRFLSTDVYRFAFALRASGMALEGNALLAYLF